ncbi:hypothetical protein SFRURICE_020943 [Spodoptera frugiperda]|nr:hypothetical protein SFRURICE_020943 [Spodoptera frugiperda]
MAPNIDIDRGFTSESEIGKGGWPPVTSPLNATQRKRLLTSIFSEAVVSPQVSLRSSRPIRAEAWLSHT